MSRSLLLLTFLLAAPAAAAPASDLKDPFRPAPAEPREAPTPGDGLREPAAEPVRDPPSDLRDPFAAPAPAGDPDTSGDLRNPWARAPVVQRPASHRLKNPAPAPASDLRNPWSSESSKPSKSPSKPRRGSVSGDLRDPFTPAVQRPRKAR